MLLTGLRYVFSYRTQDYELGDGTSNNGLDPQPSVTDCRKCLIAVYHGGIFSIKVLSFQITLVCVSS